MTAGRRQKASALAISSGVAGTYVCMVRRRNRNGRPTAIVRGRILIRRFGGLTEETARRGRVTESALLC